MKNENLRYKINNIIKNEKGNNSNNDISFQEKLATISYVYRNQKYKSFKIVYMKDKDNLKYEIIEHEYINFYHSNQKSLKRTYKEWIEKISYKMYQLNADSYYIISNQTCKRPKISMLERIFIKRVSNDLSGFIGYLAIASNSYSSIILKDNKMKIEKNKIIDQFLGINAKKAISFDPFMKIQIKCELDLVKVMKEITISKRFSILICIDKEKNIEFIQNISNDLLNLPDSSVITYIRNAIERNKSEKAYIITMDKSAFERMEGLNIEKYDLNCIAYNIVNGKVNILDYSASEKETKDLEKFYQDYEKDLIFKENEER